MTPETAKLFSERILTIVNRYLKSGAIVLAVWPMLAKKDLEKLVQESYEQGKLDALNDKIKV